MTGVVHVHIMHRDIFTFTVTVATVSAALKSVCHLLSLLFQAVGEFRAEVFDPNIMDFMEVIVLLSLTVIICSIT
jgi:hypothetical protein